MTIHRKDRIGEEIKREIAMLIRDNIKDPRVNGLVSVTDVEVTKDIRYATIYVSCLGDEETQQKTLAGLKQASGYLRSELASRLTIRYMPELIFKFDHSIEIGARIDQLLADQKPKS